MPFKESLFKLFPFYSQKQEKLKQHKKMLNKFLSLINNNNKKKNIFKLNGR